MIRTKRTVLFCVALCTLHVAPGLAQQSQPTRVVVRAIARDAKIIYDNVGGANISITDAQTGEVLAQGVQRGGSGDTQLIMGPRGREQQVFATSGAAAFEALLPLSEPTLVTIAAEGPLRPGHARMKASKTLLLVPGQHVQGNGILLELHGFIVNITVPGTTPRGTVRVTADVQMMCGCPITAGGMWDASAITVHAQLRGGGNTVASALLRYDGRPNAFSGAFENVRPGAYSLEVTAAQASTGNFGRHVQPFVVQ